MKRLFEMFKGSGSKGMVFAVMILLSGLLLIAAPPVSAKTTQETFKNADGTSTTYTYVNGQITDEKIYLPNGQRVMWTTFCRNGNIKKIITYGEDGKKVKEEVFDCEDGHLKKIRYWNHPEKVKSETFWPNGQLKRRTCRVGGGKTEYYDEDGNRTDSRGRLIEPPVDELPDTSMDPVRIPNIDEAPEQGGAIFEDGFESGPTPAWSSSSTVPQIKSTLPQQMNPDGTRAGVIPAPEPMNPPLSSNPPGASESPATEFRLQAQGERNQRDSSQIATEIVPLDLTGGQGPPVIPEPQGSGPFDEGEICRDYGGRECWEIMDDPRVQKEWDDKVDQSLWDDYDDFVLKTFEDCCDSGSTTIIRDGSTSDALDALDTEFDSPDETSEQDLQLKQVKPRWDTRDAARWEKRAASDALWRAWETRAILDGLLDEAEKEGFEDVMEDIQDMADDFDPGDDPDRITQTAEDGSTEEAGSVGGGGGSSSGSGEGSTGP